MERCKFCYGTLTSVKSVSYASEWDALTDLNRVECTYCDFTKASEIISTAWFLRQMRGSLLENVPDWALYSAVETQIRMKQRYDKTNASDTP